jgi:hypothetical protein
VGRVSGAAVVYVYAAGAATLGLWGVARFPQRGPRGIGSALALVAGACFLLQATGGLTRAALDAAGPGVALPCVLLPALTLVFWSAAHVLRAAAERLAPYRR